MDFPEKISVKRIAETYDATIKGDASAMASGINEIHKVREGDITFVDHPKYVQKALKSAATIIITNEEVECPEGKTILVVSEPFDVYDQIVRRFRPFHTQESPINNSALIHPSVILEPNVTIGKHVVIGKNCHIMAGAYIGDYTKIGNRVIIQSNAVVGTDAFYFKKKDNKYTKWTSGGRVIIEDDVYVGAGCTINKGVSGDTIIGEGSKLDCQVHIGHGVVLGKNCLLAAQVGIGGKTIVGDNATIYGQVGIGQSLTIGDNVTLLGKSGVIDNVESGEKRFGYPAADRMQKLRELATLRNLAKK